VATGFFELVAILQSFWEFFVDKGIRKQWDLIALWESKHNLTQRTTPLLEPRNPPRTLIPESLFQMTQLP
jgi:hypothetical protein